ncbi:MAG: hypothetical protein HY302_16335 [Opitutae bacterium]|nr:hypothetical protein [Opitutae bacterium]
MTEPVPARSAGRFADSLLAFTTGLWLALLQCAYFFLLEAYLTSRATSFFIALFFWLGGFLAGLNLAAPRAFPALVVAAPLAYYAALGGLAVFPYHLWLLAPVGACIAVAGALAGAFFPFAASRFPGLKILLLHENNGFVLGLLLSLLGLVFHGRLLLTLPPVLGALAVGGLLLSRR